MTVSRAFDLESFRSFLGLPSLEAFVNSYSLDPKDKYKW